MTVKKKVTILGSTGSIGENTVDLLKAKLDKFEIVALSAGSNVELLIEQVKILKPKFVAIADESKSDTLREALATIDKNIEISVGEGAMIWAASHKVDITISAIVGFAGLRPTMQAIENSKAIALANKECLVCAGHFMMDKIAKFGVDLLPVDSEHNAIFQVFDDQNSNNIKRLILTASGGPFLRKTREELKDITPKEAVVHPNWSMGAKISVDSATMMNKSLEIIETHYIFNMPSSKIDVLMHPQSVVHSMVEYIDGSILAQMGAFDMRTPIAYALAWPSRMKTTGSRLDISQAFALEFIPPDLDRFPMLRLVREVMDTGGAMPIVFNTANEIAVSEFLSENISFLDIENTIFDITEYASSKQYMVTSIEDIFEIDREIRIISLEKIKKHATNIGYA